MEKIESVVRCTRTDLVLAAAELGRWSARADAAEIDSPAWRMAALIAGRIAGWLYAAMHGHPVSEFAKVLNRDLALAAADFSAEFAGASA